MGHGRRSRRVLHFLHILTLLANSLARSPRLVGLKAGEAANTAPDSGPPGAYGSFDGISREQAQAWLDEKLSNSEGAWSITQNWTTAFESVH